MSKRSPDKSGNKKQTTHKEWETAIRTARQFVANYDKTRWIICDLALEVCDISHGGRKTHSIYTVKKFAEEIEINYKTLLEWTRVKRLVYNKLPKMIQTKAHKYNYQDFAEIVNHVEEETSRGEVYKRWIEHFDHKPEEMKFRKYDKYLDSIVYNAQRPLVMKDVETETIQNFIKKFTLCTNLFNKELELREKFANADRQNAARLNIKKELADRLVQS